MTTKFSRSSRVSQERSFNLDSLERNHWRNRINQLKRELRESPYRSSSSSASALSNIVLGNTALSNAALGNNTLSNTALSHDSRPLPRRRPSH